MPKYFIIPAIARIVLILLWIVIFILGRFVLTFTPFLRLVLRRGGKNFSKLKRDAFKSVLPLSHDS